MVINNILRNCDKCGVYYFFKCKCKFCYCCSYKSPKLLSICRYCISNRC